ncbi:tetratricopeptide repeat protein [Azospirillum sp.]|uniref:tetratricopeptide repeat protein n=1 Tax=Azospirillum sp. TaxID=34012 RepID=UPI002D5F3E87|nr:tetratricopeptide repeat protein [Azospirillum sp.]HYD64803.1 tetratricopeptide repeat protein [Azospirillum sp.]
MGAWQWVARNWAVLFQGIGVTVLVGAFSWLSILTNPAPQDSKQQSVSASSAQTNTSSPSAVAANSIHADGNVIISPQSGSSNFDAHRLIDDYAKAKVDAASAKHATEAARRDAVQAIARARQSEQQLAEALKALDEERRNRPAQAPTIDAALDALGRGRTNEAETIFKDILASKEAAGRQSFKEAAVAAGHLGALAFLNDTEKALDAYRKAVELDPYNHDGWNRLGHLLFRIGALNDAQQAYERVLSLGDKAGEREVVAKATGNLGLIYQMRGDLDKAEEFHHKALNLNNEIGQKDGMARQYGNLGLIYRIRGNLAKAEEHHQKALDLNTELGRNEGIASSYSNLGLIYQMRGNLYKSDKLLDKSEELLDKSEELFRKALDLEISLGRKDNIANIYGNLGVTYRLRNDLNKAEEHLHKALNLSREIGRKDGIANALANIGFLYKEKGDILEAEANWQKALSIFIAIGMKRETEAVQGWLSQIAPTKPIPQR